MSRILITGGAGYIGSHAAWACIDAGHDVVVLDDLSTGSRDCVPPDATFLEACVGDRETVLKALVDHKIDAIMHFAGSIIVPESVANPIKYYRNNTAYSMNLIAAALEAGVSTFIFSSTAAVYAPTPDGKVDETAAIDPLTPYGTSKRMTEQMLDDSARAHDFRFVALRYFNVAGADPKRRTGQSTPNATHLIKVACQRALGKRDDFAIYGDDYDTPDGTCVRDYIHVSDLADAHLLALDYLLEGGQSAIMNAGYGRGASVKEVVETVRRVSGVDFDVTEAPRREGDAPILVATNDKLMRTLSWKPQFADLELIVRDALEWERMIG